MKFDAISTVSGPLRALMAVCPCIGFLHQAMPKKKSQIEVDQLSGTDYI
jgi:hypothetical protein